MSGERFSLPSNPYRQDRVFGLIITRAIPGCPSSCPERPIQDVDVAAASIDKDLGHSVIFVVHGDNQDIVVREKDGMGV